MDFRQRSLIGLLALAIVAAPASVRSADQALFFSRSEHAPLPETPMVIHPRDEFKITLNLRTKSIEDRGRFPLLVIDSRLEPNVRFEVTEFRKGTPYLPASFWVEGQLDRQVDGPYHMAQVWLWLGRSKPFYWIADHFGYIGKMSEKHWEGTYRIRAFYREFTSPPIFVTVQ